MGKAIAAIVVLILLAAGGWYVFLRDIEPAALEPEVPAMGEGIGEPIVEEEPAGEPVSAFTVRYTASGFSPATLEVPVGTTVTFINQGGPGMWVGSDEHPTHTEYSGTSRTEHCAGGTPTPGAFDQCAAGSTYSFTFDKPGTWGYHNHMQASHRGTIVVTQ